MKKTKLTTMLIQGGLLVAFAGGFYFFTQTQIQPVQVYTYARDISVNTVLTEQDVTAKHIPRDAVTSEMVLNKDEIVGKAVTTKVFPNEYVIEQKLVEASAIDPFEKMDLSNYRRIAIAVDMDEALGGNLKRGDKVDLAFVGEGESKESGEEFTYSKTFLQDLLVYSVIDDAGRKYIDQTDGTVLMTTETGEVVESGPLAVVTLAVTSAQAEEIQARLAAGEVKILGRFDASVDSATPGYTVGGFGPVQVQPGDPETN